MTVEALIFLKSKPRKHRNLVEWLARSTDGKTGKGAKYKEPGVKEVFHSEGEYDVIVHLEKRDKRAVRGFVAEIGRKKLKKTRAVALSNVHYVHGKLPGDP